MDKQKEMEWMNRIKIHTDLGVQSSRKKKGKSNGFLRTK